jgi:hypothetical protein
LYQLDTFLSRVITLLIFIAGITCSVSAQETGRLIIIGCPDSAVVSLDHKIILPDMGGWYEVPAGDRMIEIHKLSTLVFYKNMTFKADEEHKIIFECVINCAGLKIICTPGNAQLTLDDEYIGLTPYVNYFMKDGKHRYSLALDGYAPLADTFSLVANEVRTLDLTLDRSQAYKDSVKNEQMRVERSRKIMLNLVFGTIAVVSGGAGAYYDMSAKKSMKKADEAAVSYDNARSGFSEHKSVYYQYRNDAVRAGNKRNVLYGASGVMLFSLGLSFFF